MLVRLLSSILLLSAFFIYPASAQTFNCTNGTEVILEIGYYDNFAYPTEPTFPDANLQLYIDSLYIPVVPLDYTAISSARAHTFIWTEQALCDAELTTHVRAITENTENDRFNLEFRDEWLQSGGEVFRWTLPLSDLTGTAWEDNDEATIVLHLSNLPVDLYGRTSVLSYMMDGNLDVMIQDDTNVDYMILRLCVLCSVPTEKHSWGEIKVLYTE